MLCRGTRKSYANKPAGDQRNNLIKACSAGSFRELVPRHVPRAKRKNLDKTRHPRDQKTLYAGAFHGSSFQWELSSARLCSAATIREFFYDIFPQQGLPLGSLLVLRDWSLRAGEADSAKKLRVAGWLRVAGVPQGSLKNSL